MRGLKTQTEPWCTTTLIGNFLVSFAPIWTAVVAPSYIDFITEISLSSTPDTLKAHPPYHFSCYSVKGFLQIYKCHPQLLFSKYFFCNCRTVNIAAVVLFLALKPNCMSSISFSLKQLYDLIGIALQRTSFAFKYKYSPYSFGSSAPVYSLFNHCVQQIGHSSYSTFS